MTLRNSIRLVAVFLLPLALCLLLRPASVSIGGDQNPKPRKVHYSDIPARVQIIGKLGKPLGQLVTVRGRWTEPSQEKPDPPLFLVHQVNGRPFDPPAEFDDVILVWGKDTEVTKKRVGEEWELRGVENGGLGGISDKAWEELGGQPRQPPTYRPPGGFITHFCYVKAKRVSGSQPTSERE